MKDEVIEQIEKKRDALKRKVRAKFKTAANLAVVEDLNYNELIGTISGRRPDPECVRVLIRVLDLKPADFPRLPKGLNDAA